MTAVLAILARAWPWLACFGIGLGTGSYLVGNHWSARYERLQSSDAQARADGEATVRKALQAQLAQAQAVSSNNASVIQRLQNENAQIAADRGATLDRVRRLEQLLVLAARTPTPSAPVPQAGSGSEPAGASGDPGPSEVEQLLIDAKDEAERNAARLNALIAQIKPQL